MLRLLRSDELARKSVQVGAKADTAGRHRITHAGPLTGHHQPHPLCALLWLLTVPVCCKTARVFLSVVNRVLHKGVRSCQPHPAAAPLQVFCLERLQAQDMASSKVLLQALAASFRDNAVPEYAPFGNALAARLQVGGQAVRLHQFVLCSFMMHHLLCDMATGCRAAQPSGQQSECHDS